MSDPFAGIKPRTDYTPVPAVDNDPFAGIKPRTDYTPVPKEQAKKAPLPSFGESGWNAIRNRANSFLGTKYGWGQNGGPSGIDCSGLVVETYKPFGISLPRTAASQYNATKRITESDLEPGDLIFLKNTGSRKGITHVGIYIGNGKWTQASSTHGVITESFDKPYNRSHLAGFGTMRHNLKKYQAKAAKYMPTLGQGSWTDAIASGNSVSQVAPPAVNTKLTTTLKAKKTPWTELIGEDKPAWDKKKPAPAPKSKADPKALAAAFALVNPDPTVPVDMSNVTSEALDEVLPIASQQQGGVLLGGVEGATGGLVNIPGGDPTTRSLGKIGGALGLAALGSAVAPIAGLAPASEAMNLSKAGLLAAGGAGSVAAGMGLAKAGMSAEEMAGRQIATGDPNEDPEGVWQGFKADLFNALVSREAADAIKQNDPARLQRAQQYLAKSPGSNSVLSGIAAGMAAEAPAFAGLSSAVKGGATLAGAAIAKTGKVPGWIAKAASIGGSTGGGAASWYQTAEGHQLLRAAMESGYPLDKPEGAAAFLLDDMAVAKAKAKARKRGVPEAAMNAFGMALGHAAIAALGADSAAAIAAGRGASAGLMGAGAFTGAKLGGATNQEAGESALTQGVLELVFGAPGTAKALRGLKGKASTSPPPIVETHTPEQVAAAKADPVPEAPVAPEVVAPEPVVTPPEVVTPPKPAVKAKVAKAAATEPVHPDLGLTKSQAKYLDDRLIEINKAADGPPLDTKIKFGAASLPQPEIIEVPGDGSFMVTTTEQVRNLHKAIQPATKNFGTTKGTPTPKGKATVPSKAQVEAVQAAPTRTVDLTALSQELQNAERNIAGYKRLKELEGKLDHWSRGDESNPIQKEYTALRKELDPGGIASWTKRRNEIREQITSTVKTEQRRPAPPAQVKAKPTPEPVVIPEQAQRAKGKPEETAPLELKPGEEYLDKGARVVFRYEGDGYATIIRARNADEVGMVVEMDPTDTGSFLPATPDILKTHAPSLQKSEGLAMPATKDTLPPPPMGGSGGPISPDPIPNTNPPVKIQDMISKLEKALGVRILQRGKVMRGSIGTYFPSTGAISAKDAGDLRTIAHDVAHFLDHKFGLVRDYHAPRVSSPYDSELFQPELQHTVKKSYTLQQRRMEGVAEFISAWIVNPAEAERIAPAFASHFKSTVSDDVLKALTSFGTDIRNWAGSPQMDAANMRMESLTPSRINALRGFLTGSRGAWSINAGDRIRQKLEDRVWPAIKAVRTALEWHGAEQNPSRSVEEMIRQKPYAARKVWEILNTKPINANGTEATEVRGGLRHVIEALDPKNLDEEMLLTQRFMTAQRHVHAVEKKGTNPRTGQGGGYYSDYKIAKRVLDDVQALPAPQRARIEECASRYRKLSEYCLRYLRDSEILTEEAFNKIREEEPYYVNWHRNGIVGKYEVLKPLEGSGLEMGNAFVGLAEQIDRVVRIGDTNRIYAGFARLLSGSNGMHEGEAHRFADIGRKDRPGQYATSFYMDGRKVTYSFDPDVHHALSLLSKVQDGNFLTVLGQALPRFARAAITHSPQFLIRNPFRDTVARMIVSRVKGQPLFPKGKAGDLTDMGLAGALHTGHYFREKNDYHKLLDRIVHETSHDKHVLTVFPDYLARLNEWLEYSEVINRKAEYVRAKRSVEHKAGWSEWDKVVYAAKQARELQDFARAGELIHELNKYVIFTSAAVRGVVRTGEAFKENPGATVARWLLYAVTPAIGVFMWNRRQGEDVLKEYRELPAYQRDFFFNFKIGPDKWARIPKPFELGVMASGIERGLDKALGNENAFDGFPKDLIRSFMPVDETAILAGAKPLVEAYFNYDTLRDRSIVSPFEDDLDVDLRKGTKNASSVGQWLQKLTHVDARKLDHLVSGFTGGMGRSALDLSDVVKGKKSVGSWTEELAGLTSTSPASGSRSVRDLYSVAQKAGLGTGSKEFKVLRSLTNKYYESGTAEERDKVARQMREWAERITPMVKGKASVKRRKRESQMR